MTCTA